MLLSDTVCSLEIELEMQLITVFKTERWSFKVLSLNRICGSKGIRDVCKCRSVQGCDEDLTYDH